MSEVHNQFVLDLNQISNIHLKEKAMRFMVYFTAFNELIGTYSTVHRTTQEGKNGTP